VNSLPLWPRLPLCILMYTSQLEFRRITILTRSVIFVLCTFFVFGWYFFSLLHPSLLAVFYGASKFNQDVSNWNTSAVTTMRLSKCTLSLSPSVATPSAVYFNVYHTTRVSSDHNSHTFCYFCVCVFETVPFLLFLWWVGLSFLCCTLSSCSVRPEQIHKNIVLASCFLFVYRFTRPFRMLFARYIHGTTQFKPIF
jgi:surface protein